MEIRNVLVPVDFSPASRFAVDYAVLFVRTFRARLTLLHVAESSPTEEDKEGKRRAEQALGRLSAMLSPEDQDDLDLQVRIRYGRIETEIRSAIDDEAANLVVMGTHHHGLIRRLLVGTATEALLRKMPVPVLTVSSDARSRTLSRIMFSTDLTESSLVGFRFALDLARTVGAQLVVLHVIEPIPLAYGGALAAIETLAEKKALIESVRRKLAELESEAARQKVVVVTEVCEGIATEKIPATAEASACDLIVLTIHEKGPVERALLGSTAESVVRDARQPVLSIPVPAEPMQFSQESNR